MMPQNDLHFCKIVHLATIYFSLLKLLTLTYEAQLMLLDAIEAGNYYMMWCQFWTFLPINISHIVDVLTKIGYICNLL